jgi:hypothetical protein
MKVVSDGMPAQLSVGDQPPGARSKALTEMSR